MGEILEKCFEGILKISHHQPECLLMKLGEKNGRTHSLFDDHPF